MTYFKIIKNDEVIDVGCVFLKWDNAKHKMYICDVSEAQFVQTFDESKIYKAGWLNPAPQSAGEYETVQVEVITETEFEDLRALLSEGEPIVIEEPQEERQVVHQEEPEEKPMSIAEMREMILAQQKQIEALMEKLQ